MQNSKRKGRKRNKVDQASVNAFLVDVFHKTLNGRSVIYAIGKLETGETFALLDEFRRPHFFIRKDDQVQFQSLAAKQRYQVAATENRTMDQSSVLEISASTVHSLNRLRRLCEEHHLRTYEADIRFTDQFLMEKEIMGSFLLRGEWRESDQVDRFYHNPEYAPVIWQPDLSILSLDIETSETADQIYGISLVSYLLSGKTLREQMLIVGKPETTDHEWVGCFEDERSLLVGLSESVLDLDPDLITGWSVIDFDLSVLAKLC